MDLIIPLMVLLLYGIGAGVFSKRVLPRWRFYAELGNHGRWGESAQHVLGFLCAAVWPLTWLLLGRLGGHGKDVR